LIRFFETRGTLTEYLGKPLRGLWNIENADMLSLRVNDVGVPRANDAWGTPTIIGKLKFYPPTKILCDVNLILRDHVHTLFTCDRLGINAKRIDGALNSDIRIM
jgi:hypothetical protein